MLVLTRKQGEEIRIGDDIVLKVTAVQGGRVRIGIDAPRSHRIVRPEAEERETVPTTSVAPAPLSRARVERRVAVHG